MAKRHFHLSDTELAQFRQAEQRTDKAAELKRLQAVRLYGSGVPIVQIMHLTGCAESSIRNWTLTYQREGLAGLRLQYGRSAQNASKLTAAQRANLQQRLQEYRPDQGLAADDRRSHGSFWTVSDLQLVVEQWYGVVYQDVGSYRNLLHACGFSYQRAERLYKSRPSPAALADFEAELEKK
jgi:transposase